MIGHASVQSPPVNRTAPVAAARGKGATNLPRRAIEALVAVLAFGVWGTLAYRGGFRLLARAEGITLSSSWVIDVMSLFIGVSGSIAGMSALWAITMRALGRTPGSLVGAPDDGPADTAYRSEHNPDGRYRGEDAVPRP